MSASVSVLPRPTASPPPDPCEAERHALRSTIEALVAATAQLDAIQIPLRRLQEAIGGAQAAEERLADCRRLDDQALAAWLASGATGPRPQPSDATLASERDAAVCRQDAAAARGAMPAVEAQYTAAVHVIHGRQAARDAAAITLAAAIAKLRAAELAARLRSMLAEQASILSVADALVSAFNDAARPAAADIRLAVDKVLRETGIPHRPEPGRRLIDRLMTDASADFETGESK
jgi:hypothetical protein